MDSLQTVFTKAEEVLERIEEFADRSIEDVKSRIETSLEAAKLRLEEAVVLMSQFEVSLEKKDLGGQFAKMEDLSTALVDVKCDLTAAQSHAREISEISSDCRLDVMECRHFLVQGVPDGLTEEVERNERDLKTANEGVNSAVSRMKVAHPASIDGRMYKTLQIEEALAELADAEISWMMNF